MLLSPAIVDYLSLSGGLSGIMLLLFIDGLTPHNVTKSLKQNEARQKDQIPLTLRDWLLSVRNGLNNFACSHVAPSILHAFAISLVNW